MIVCAEGFFYLHQLETFSWPSSDRVLLTDSHSQSRLSVSSSFVFLFLTLWIPLTGISDWSNLCCEKHQAESAASGTEQQDLTGYFQTQSCFLRTYWSRLPCLLISQRLNPPWSRWDWPCQPWSGYPLSHLVTSRPCIPWRSGILGRNSCGYLLRGDFQFLTISAWVSLFLGRIVLGKQY